MAELLTVPDDDHWDERDDLDGEPCTWCGGVPDLQECDDPLQCCDPECDGQWHPCTACNGTGLAANQVMW
jgi:hypothetical protein